MMTFQKRPSARTFRVRSRSAQPCREAFTLVELIVVITILAVLATVGFLALSGYTKDASSASVRANLKTIAQAVSTESSALSESPRKYVSHSGGMVLSGAKFAGVALVPGPYGSVGTNYSAGTPDFSALRMDASKFRNPDGTPFRIGAFDWTETLPSWKPRIRSFFQIAGFPESGISASGAVLVESSYPASLAGATTSSGLIASSSGSSSPLADTTAPAVPAAAAAAVSAWVAKMGGTTPDATNSIAVDSSGNVYVFGRFHNSSTDPSFTKDFAGNTLFGITTTSSQDIFLAKLDSSGTQQWIRNMGGNFSDDASSVAVDSSGNVYALWRCYNNLANARVAKDFAGNTLSGVTATASDDIFLAKLDSSGTQQWMKSMGGTSSDIANAVTVDSSGNVYIAGYYYNSSTNANGTKDFAGNTLSGVTATASNDAFLAKLDSSGTQQWIKNMGGTAAESPRSIVVDSSANIYVSGQYTNNSSDGNFAKDFAGNTLYGMAGTAGFDSFLIKLNSSGTQQWIRNMGGAGYDSPLWIALDSSSNIHVSGQFNNSSTNTNGTKDFAGNTLFGITATVSDDAFLAKLDSSGTQQWIARMGGTSGDYAYSVATDSSGNAYVTGNYPNTDVNVNGVKDFAGNTLSGMTATLGNDIFLAKLDSSGTQQWVKKMGGFLGDMALSVAVSSGNVYVAGNYSCSDACTMPTASQDFAGNALPGVTATASADAFVTLVP